MHFVLCLKSKYYFVGALVIDHGDITIILPEDSTNVWLKVVELKLDETYLIKIEQNTQNHYIYIIERYSIKCGTRFPMN